MKGKKISVILPLETYQELLEDLEDLAAVSERRNEGKNPKIIPVTDIPHPIIQNLNISKHTFHQAI